MQERQEDRGMLHLFVKQLLQAVMERSCRECELASLLLVSLSPLPLSPEQVRPPMLRSLRGIVACAIQKYIQNSIANPCCGQCRQCQTHQKYM